MTSIEEIRGKCTGEDYPASFSEWILEHLEPIRYDTLVVQLEYEQGKIYLHIETIAEFLSFCYDEFQQRVKTKLLSFDYDTHKIYYFLEFIAVGILNWFFNQAL